MAFQFADLDDMTRQQILAEVDDAIASGSLYYSERMTEAGKAAYPALLREAIQRGTEQTLAQTLARSGYWKAYETRVRQGRPHQARVPHNAHETFAEGEFNRFFVRGLCRRALAEGINELEMYRANAVMNPRPQSQAMIGKRVDPEALLDDLRTHQGLEPALGLPPGPNSGLSVRIPR